MPKTTPAQTPPAAESDPQQGGSWLRNEDGTLVKASEPAAPSNEPDTEKE